MKNVFTWWQFVLIGAGIATAFWCVAIFLLGVWAGWPRAREKDAWRAVVHAQAHFEATVTAALYVLTIGTDRDTNGTTCNHEGDGP